MFPNFLYQSFVLYSNSLASHSSTVSPYSSFNMFALHLPFLWNDEKNIHFFLPTLHSCGASFLLYNLRFHLPVPSTWGRIGGAGTKKSGPPFGGGPLNMLCYYNQLSSSMQCRNNNDYHNNYYCDQGIAII
jgi:hypothetical protein